MYSYQELKNYLFPHLQGDPYGPDIRKKNRE